MWRWKPAALLGAASTTRPVRAALRSEACRNGESPRARFETDMPIETASSPIGERLDEACHPLDTSLPVIRTLGPPKQTGLSWEGDAEMPLEMSDKLSTAVSRLLAAGQLAEVIFPDGRKSTTFVMPEALLNEEVQKLNDPGDSSTTGHNSARGPLPPRLRQVISPGALLGTVLYRPQRSAKTRVTQTYPRARIEEHTKDC
jgi:hypothetical protein